MGRCTWAPFYFRRAVVVSRDGVGSDIRGSPAQGQVSPFKVGNRGEGGLESRRYAVGKVCVISLANFGHPPHLPSLFPFSARIDIHVKRSETAASGGPTDLADCLQSNAPQLAVVRPSSRLPSGPWASHRHTPRRVLGRLGGVPFALPASRLESLTRSIFFGQRFSNEAHTQRFDSYLPARDHIQIWRPSKRSRVGLEPSLAGPMSQHL